MFYLNEVSVGHTSINTPNQKKNVNSIASLTGGGISGLKQKSADRVKTV